MSITTHLNKGFSSYSHPSYDDIKSACVHIAHFIHYNATNIGGVQLIVGLTRGGLVPAVELSNLLNVPMVAIGYSSKKGSGDNKNHTNTLPVLPSKKILLVDDLADSGFTLKEVKEYYVEQGHEVFTTVVFYKEKVDAVHIPDVWAVKVSENFGWIYFPWEFQTTNHN